jgi:hypothetical protein
MENPATWGEVERVIHEVLAEDYRIRAGRGIVVGLSLERRIADALRDAGLLV